MSVITRRRPSAALRSLAVFSILAVAFSISAGTSAAATVLRQASSASVVRHAVNERLCTPPTRPNAAMCMAWRRVVVPAGTPHSYSYKVNPQNAALYGPAGGYTPATLASAYGYDPDGGQGMTVAVINWRSSPHVTANLNAFDAQYGLPKETASSFRVVNEDGNASPLPAADSSASTEINLDVQAVRAVCHGCAILLVEANRGQLPNLARAENTAVRLGAQIVSNSWGVPEVTGTTIGPVVAAAFDHPGVVITASAGDDGDGYWDLVNSDGYPPQHAAFPASSPSVVAVGGTRLAVDRDGHRLAETVWNSNGAADRAGRLWHTPLGASGGGCSLAFAAPLWQRRQPSYGRAGCGGKKLSVDVSALADPATGLDIYDPYSLGGWATIGGTSLSSPVIAAMWALAGGAHGLGTPARALYQNLAYRPQYLRDVVYGGNGWCGTATAADCAQISSKKLGVANPNVAYGAQVDCSFAPRGAVVPRASNPRCTAGPGFDGPTGVGSPRGLQAFVSTTPVVTWSVTRPLEAGRAASFSARISDPVRRATVVRSTWTWGDGTESAEGVAQASHTYEAPGTYTVTLTIVDSVGQTASRTRAVTVTR